MKFTFGKFGKRAVLSSAVGLVILGSTFATFQNIASVRGGCASGFVLTNGTCYPTTISGFFTGGNQVSDVIDTELTDPCEHFSNSQDDVHGLKVDQANTVCQQNRFQGTMDDCKSGGCNSYCLSQVTPAYAPAQKVATHAACTQGTGGSTMCNCKTTTYFLSDPAEKRLLTSSIRRQ